MERVKIPAGIRGSEKCGEIPKASVAGPNVLVLARTLDEQPLVVGGEVHHDTADERLIRDGKWPILITSNLPKTSP